jgi:hypothetical protein
MGRIDNAVAVRRCSEPVVPKPGFAKASPGTRVLQAGFRCASMVPLTLFAGYACAFSTREANAAVVRACGGRPIAARSQRCGDEGRVRILLEASIATALTLARDVTGPMAPSIRSCPLAQENLERRGAKAPLLTC